MISRKTSITDCVIVMTAVLALLLLAGGAGATPSEPIEIWNKTFEGRNWAFSVQQTSDGGYIIAGHSYGGQNAGVEPEYVSGAWLIKTDANGNQQWNKTFGKGNDMAFSAQQTTDGGYILVGEKDNDENKDAWLIKTDVNGNELWSKTFGGNKDDSANSVQQTSDGGYILVGTTSSYGAGKMDGWLIKTDANGNLQWSKTFGEPDYDYLESVHQTSDSGYIMAGSTASNSRSGVADAWLIKTDKNGDELWSKRFGGPIKKDQVFSVDETNDGGYILAGLTASYSDAYYAAWLIKTDKNGDEQWNRTFGGRRGDDARSVQQTLDGGYIFVGNTESFGNGESDVWLIKTDKNGNAQWNKTFGGIYEDWGRSVLQASDGNFVIAGKVSSKESGDEAWLIKVGNSGASSQSSKTKISDGITPSKDTAPDINRPAEKSTPGFEIFGAILSMAILIFLRRKNYENVSLLQ